MMKLKPVVEAIIDESYMSLKVSNGPSNSLLIHKSSTRTWSASFSEVDSTHFDFKDGNTAYYTLLCETIDLANPNSIDIIKRLLELVASKNSQTPIIPDGGAISIQ